MPEFERTADKPRPIRRGRDRHQREKDRVRLPESQRRGVTAPELVFHAEYDTELASESLAAAFRLPTGAKLLKRTYRTGARADETPLSLVRSYLRYEQVAVNPALLDAGNEPWPGGTQHQLGTLGIEIDRVTDRITARAPSAEEISDLELATGVPVFELRKTSIDIRDRVVEVADMILPADRTEFFYTTRLCRWQA